MTQAHYYKVICSAKDKGDTFRVYVIATNETTARLKGIAVGYRAHPNLKHIWGESAETVNKQGEQ